ncbi:MAG: 2-C-methyl-D-erythritol 4-phosphate cytidylyltransferase, partial [Hyphomicrobium sp.]|nr:2-C-methyl-D-erythritol 4-phosphate cytidylyltransferase [Hyphomicrobium sp.]
MTTTVAVIVAAGRGTRAQSGASTPKQYRQLAGEPVLAHSLRLLTEHPQIDGAVVVINPQDGELYQDASAPYS